MVKNKREALTPRRRPLQATQNKTIARVLTRPGSSAVPAPAAANIRVVVRVRPPNDKEQGDNFKNVVKIVDDQMLIFDPKEDEQPFFYHGVQQRTRDLLKKENKDITFVFDNVYNNTSTNLQVFQSSTQTLIGTLMDGYNCSVFAYGATGAGKTFTMIGNSESPGITYLTMKDLFKRKEELSGEREFELMVTYIEVYNELVKDLLNPGPPLNLREDSKYGVMIPGVKGHKISCPEEMFSLLEQGNQRRTQHPTDANAESSRSHAVFQVYIQMTIKLTQEVRRAKLSMIDLAGSERGSATGFVGARFKEGANINKSLLALGNCINNLADGQRHIPYRDSKLTRLLKDSLGGNCHTIMIANVSPSSLSFDDTYNTLKYATRAKKIKSNLKRNVVNADMHVDQYIKLVDDLKTENTGLKSDNVTLKAEISNLKHEIEFLKAQQSAQTLVNQIKEQTATPEIVKEDADVAKPRTDLLEQFNRLIEEKKQIMEREYQMQSAELGMSLRRKLKQEMNRRLSDLHLKSPEKEEAHRKLSSAVDRFQKKEDVAKNELAIIHKTREELDEKIRQLVSDNSELTDVATIADWEISSLDYKYKWELSQKETKILLDEHKDKDSLLEKVTHLLKPLYLNLLGRGDMPKSFVNEYDNLVLDFQGRKNMCWVDVGSSDSGVVVVSESDEAPRNNKRKIESEQGSTGSLNSTFVKPPAPQSSPAGFKCGATKRTAQSPRKHPISPRNKENKVMRRPLLGRLETVRTFAPVKSITKSLADRPAFRC